MTMNKVPTDIAALTQMDLDAWHNNFELTLSCHDYNSMANEIYSAWRRAALRMEPIQCDIFLCDAFPFWFSQILHANIVKNDIKSAGMEYEATELSKNFFLPDWGFFADQYKLGWQNNSLLMTAKSFVKTLSSLNASKAIRVLGGENLKAICLGSDSHLRSQYILDKGLSVTHMYPAQLVGNLSLEKEISPIFKKEVTAFLEEISMTSWFTQAGADSDFRAKLEEVLCRRLSILNEIYQAVLEKQINESDMLLVNESAKPIHKIISSAWRQKGGTSVGFHHGSAAGEILHESRALKEYFAYSKFVCPNSNIANSFNEEYNLGAAGLGLMPCCFDFVRPTRGKSQTERVEKVVPAYTSCGQQRKSVVLMGYPMNALRYHSHEGMYWQCRLNLEIKLVKLLFGWGCHVYYKMHPERSEHVGRIMQNYGAKVLGGKIEDFSFTPDFFLITYSESSSFPILLKTKTPILFVNPQHHRWQLGHKNKIAKRCLIIDSHVTPSGDICFDEGQIKSALHRKDFTLTDEYYDCFYR
jgi:hypothetical protein